MIEYALVALGIVLVFAISSTLNERTPVPLYLIYPMVGSVLVLLWYPVIISSSAVLLILIAPPVFIAALDIHQLYQTKKVLSGGYGEVAKWAGEIIEEGEDRHFILAMNALPQEEIMEVSIIAESKEEMRELIKERFESMDDESIPEDFT